MISFILILFFLKLQAQTFTLPAKVLPKSQNQYLLSEASEKKRLQLYKSLRHEVYKSFRDQGAPAPQDPADLRGFNELVPFVSPSPDQEDAGTCLFMSLTGIAEWWLAKLSNVKFTQDGPTDLSERWWVNVNDRFKRSRLAIDNWITDTIYLFNQSPAVLNADYRYTKGWSKTSWGQTVKAKPNEGGANYGTLYNWIDEIDLFKPKTMSLPKFERTVIYKDPDQNPWQFGGLTFAAVDKVKSLLQTYKAPIQVVYNHLGYWHSVFIVGYDDELPTYNCYFIRETKEYFASERNRTQAEMSRTNDDQLLGELKKKYTELVNNEKKLEKVHKRNGGCRAKGMFYVRDSQYPDASEEIYKYDPKNPGSYSHYAKRIILREYNWLSDLSNHVVLISVKNR